MRLPRRDVDSASLLFSNLHGLEIPEPDSGFLESPGDDEVDHRQQGDGAEDYDDDCGGAAGRWGCWFVGLRNWTFGKYAFQANSFSPAIGHSANMPFKRTLPALQLDIRRICISRLYNADQVNLPCPRRVGKFDNIASQVLLWPPDRLCNRSFGIGRRPSHQ